MIRALPRRFCAWLPSTLVAGLTLALPLACSGADFGDSARDTPDQCEPHEMWCGACVDSNSDPAHCGGCNQPCAGGDVCEAGTCVASPGGSTGGNGSGSGGNGSGTGGDGSGTGGNGSGTGGNGSESCEEDACPMETGLTYACQQRFALGVNYAWHYFGGDFGGISEWEQAGVSLEPAHASAFAAMKSNGVSVIRWWMFPEFRSSGIAFDGNDDPTGLTGTTVADIHAALSLAETHDLYLVFTLFSFDNFRPSRTDSGLYIPGLSGMVRDATRRTKVIENIVRPVAQAVAQSPNSRRLLGWDVINEPEWAISAEPSAPSGGQFDPNGELDAVTLQEMKALINETLAVLKEETPWALRSVGWAAAKWVWAFSDITEVDFHQPHIYGWVHEWWPYTQSPAELGYTGKPTVMGEFYLTPMPLSPQGNDSFSTIVNSWYDNGYAGAWAWQYYEADLRANLNLIKAFADSKGCTVSY